MHWAELRERLGHWPMSSTSWQRMAIMLGLAAIGYFLAAGTRLETRVMVAWDAGVLGWLGLMLWIMAGCDAERTKTRSRHIDPSSLVPLAVSIIAAVFAFCLIGYLSTNPANWTPAEKQAHFAVSVLAIVATWGLVHMTFTIQYTRYYYDEADPETAERTGHDEKGGLDFAGDLPPDYLDFLYYSVTIAICAATSDTNVSSRTLRRLTLVHGLVGFFFYTVILGLVLNFVTNFF